MDSSSSKPTAVVYIGGTGRSGSTLLARMLGQTPGVAAVGELRYVLGRGVLGNHLCGCGEPFRSCPFWKEVFGLALGGMEFADAERLLEISYSVDRIRYIPLLLAPGLRSRAYRELWREHSAFLARLYRAVADVSRASVVIDSSKDPSYAYMLRTVPELELSVLHLVRDSRAVAYSWLRPKVRPEIHWRLAHMRKRPPLRSGALWTEYHLLFELLERIEPSVRRLPYEEFVAAPETVIADLRAWIGRPSVAPADELPWFVHDISGNPMRFAEGPTTIVEDVEWKQRMRPLDRRVVTAVTAPLLRRYGYFGHGATK